jgi:methyl-CpG-binding domain protein 4
VKTPTQTSPYNLLQEQLRGDPWKLLVACIMLNRTHNRQVKEIIWKFFERWPDWQTVVGAGKEEFQKETKPMIKSLGFMNRRADSLWNMTEDYWMFRPDLFRHHIDKISGVGKYARDSFNMFVNGYLVEGATDKKLQLYVDWAKEETERAALSGRDGQSLPENQLVPVPPG